MIFFKWVFISICLCCVLFASIDYVPKITQANRETKFALADRLVKQLLFIYLFSCVACYMIYHDIHW